MQIFRQLNQFRPDSSKPLVLGLGNFDGLHLGHQALLKHVVDQARDLGGTPALFTFSNHPHEVLHPETKPDLLMNAAQKLFLFSELGIEVCLWPTFDQAFSKITAQSFVEEYLVKQFQIQEICMGYNAFFGYKRQGNVEQMQKFSQTFGFKFEQVNPIETKGDFISSTRIRKLIREGNLSEAEECLGYPFRVLGKVVQGNGRGVTLGFPTANIQIQSDVLPPIGVYPIRLRILETSLEENDSGILTHVVHEKGDWRPGVLNYGKRPTFGEQETGILEAHLFDFDENIYDKSVEVVFYPQIRQEMTFDGVEDLKSQIQQDIQVAKGILKESLYKDPGFAYTA